MPGLNDDLDQMRQNLQTWKEYEETEEDKQVYEQKVKVISIQVSSKSPEKQSSEEAKRWRV